MAIECPKCHFVNATGTLFCGKCAAKLDASSELSVTLSLEGSPGELSRGLLFAGRYEIIEELGAGGMGRVYRVLDAKLNEEVALKLIRPEIAAERRMVDRFRNELKTARRIRHKNVAGMYDLHEEGRTLFLTMEYVRGEDLKSLIHRTKTLPVRMALSVGRQIAEGLGEAHKLGIVHRDLKPGNIMIDKEGNAKIMDFGIARMQAAPGTTAEGTLVGTPEYMSPEQVEGKEADPRSDIYALGIILFEMIIGHPPFGGETPLSILHKHRFEAPPVPKKLSAQVPDRLNRLILRCLEKDKARRYQSAEELVTDLAAIEDKLPTVERIAVKRKTAIRRKITVNVEPRTILLPALIVAVIIAAAFLFVRPLLHKKTALVPKIENSVAVVSFTNQTGDKAYDYLQEAIPNLIITNLEQTGDLYVATWERMHDILETMGKKDVGTIDRNLGFAACRKEGIGAIVLGSYIKAGDTFATDVKVLDVRSKELLKSYRSKGNGIDSILATQVDELSRGIAQGIGWKYVEAEPLKVADVTTSSMEAYRYYLKARDAYDRGGGDPDGIIRDLNKAIEIDPALALAYLKLGEIYIDTRNYTASHDALKKAMALSDRVSEKERLYIETLASARGLGRGRDLDGQTQALQRIVEKYPKEKQAHYYMGRHYQNLQEWTKAIEEFTKALKLDPRHYQCLLRLGYSNLEIERYEEAVAAFKSLSEAVPKDANAYASLGDAYFYLGEFDLAIRAAERSWSLQPGIAGTAFSLSYLHALSENYPEAVRWIDEAERHSGSAEDKGSSLLWKGFYLFWLGSFSRALAAMDRADELLRASGNELAADETLGTRALLCYHQGDLQRARKFEDQAFDAVTKYYVRYYSGHPEYIKRNELLHARQLGLIEMKEGRSDAISRWLEEAKPFIEKDTFSDSYYDRVKAEVRVYEGRYDEAIVILRLIPERRSPLAWSGTILIDYNLEFPSDALARACELKGETDRALSEYKRLIVIDPKGKDRHLVHPTYHYRLARLYEQTGQKSRAAGSYKKFLDLWKDADPGLPELEAARKRLAGLKD